MSGNGVVTELLEGRVRVVEERNRRVERMLLEFQGDIRRLDRSHQELKEIVMGLREDVRAVLALVGAKEAL